MDQRGVQNIREQIECRSEAKIKPFLRSLNPAQKCAQSLSLKLVAGIDAVNAELEETCNEAASAVPRCVVDIEQLEQVVVMVELKRTKCSTGGAYTSPNTYASRRFSFFCRTRNTKCYGRTNAIGRR